MPTTIVDGDHLIVFPNSTLGQGQVTLFSTNGKQVSGYRLEDEQQITLERPEASGIYTLSFSGANGVCSEQLVLP